MEAKKYKIYYEGQFAEATYSEIGEITNIFQEIALTLEQQRAEIWADMSESERKEWREYLYRQGSDIRTDEEKREEQEEFAKYAELAEEQDELPF